MLCVSLKHEKIVISERHRRSSFRRCVMNRWIRHPGLTCKLQMKHKATPLVPLKDEMTGEEQEEDCDQNDCPDLRDLEEIIPEVVDGGSIETAAERNAVLCWHGKKRRIEGKADKRIVDVSLDSLERRVHPERRKGAFIDGNG